MAQVQNVHVRILPRTPPIDGRSVELRQDAQYIQWRYAAALGVAATEWVDLVALAALVGPEGPAIEMHSDGVSIQYRVVGDVSWIDLVALSVLKGDQGIPGADTGRFFRVNAVDTTGASPSTAYEAGDTVDGVTLTAGMFVLRATSGGNASDGVYVVPASGAASRHQSFAAYNDHPASYFTVIAGTTYGNSLWHCTSGIGGTLGSTAIAIAQKVDPTTPLVGGQCQLRLSGSDIKLMPVNGNKVIVNGAQKSLSSSGVTLTASGLTPGTLYYIYLYDNSGTLTLEASATGHTTDTTTGIEIKSGDATRAMVGWAVPDTGPIFVHSATKQHVRSWFNDTGVLGSGAFTADRTYATGIWGEVNSEIRVNVISRGETFLAMITGTHFHAAASGKLIGTVVGIDGTTPQDGPFVSCSPNTTGGFNYMPVGGTWAFTLSEGKHYITLLSYSYDTVSWTYKGNASSSSARCVLSVATAGNGAAMGDTYIRVRGVLACDGSGNWTLMNDSTHRPVNVASISQNSTSITINYSVTGNLVRGAQVSLDETLSTTSQVDKAGPSVGLSSMAIQLGKIDGSGNTSVVNPSSVTGGNLWFEATLS